MGDYPRRLFDELAKQVKLKQTGLMSDGQVIKFLGRRLQLKDGVIKLFMQDDCLMETFKEHGLENAKPVVAPGVATMQAPDGVSSLDDTMTNLYRKGVGKCMWLVPLRGDIYYTTKELARHLQSPTLEQMMRLKHLLRYLKGTQHYTLEIAPLVQLEEHVPVELKVQVDSDWAGCRETRKSTSGCVIELLGCAIHAFSRTQGTIATSSGEAELYAIGSGVSEGLGIVNLLEEAELLPKVVMTILTDSTSAKAIATRMGVTKLTRHIQLRFLYMQDLVANGVLKVKKIDTKLNPADIMTKYVNTAVLHAHLTRVGLHAEHGELRHCKEQNMIGTISAHSRSKVLRAHVVRKTYYICSLFQHIVNYRSAGDALPRTITMKSFGAPSWLTSLAPPATAFMQATRINERRRTEMKATLKQLAKMHKSLITLHCPDRDCQVPQGKPIRDQLRRLVAQRSRSCTSTCDRDRDWGTMGR